MFKLHSNFQPTGDQPHAIKKVTDNFNSGLKDQVLLGVTGSGKTFSMAHIIQNFQKKTLILAHNKTLAAQLYAEFKEFFPDNAVEYFISYYDYYRPEAYVPGSDTYIEKDSAVNDEIDKLRHSTTRSLLERDDVIVIASVSCIYGIGSPDEYGNQKITIFIGEERDRDDLLKKLVEIQYQRNDIDFTRGCFRVRGDIVEVFPAHEDSLIIRIEFFDDEIDGLFLVDPLTGSIQKEIKKAVVYPSSHYVVSTEVMTRALETIKMELRETLQKLNKQNKLVEAQRLEMRTMLDIEMMEEMGFCSGIENYSRHFTAAEAGDPPPTLVDYFGDDYLMMIDESHITCSQVGAMFKGDRSRKQNLVDFGFRLPSALDNRPLNFTEFERRLDKTLFVSATPGNYELERTGGEFAEQVIRPTGLLDPLVEKRDASTQVDDLLGECRKEIKKGGRVLITTLTKKLSEDLTNYYKGLGLKIRYLHSDIDALQRVEILNSLREGEFDILVGINLLREGLDLPEVTLVGILDADKEGFLRSTRSLIQTIGRAARNSEGRVILYAYKVTKSMREAMKLTLDRREKQIKYNKENGITPKTINKRISYGVIETLRGKKKKSQRVSTFDQDINAGNIDSVIGEMKSRMKEAAGNLEFEKAARIRDEIKELNNLRLIL